MKHLFVGAFLLYVVSIFAQPPINYYQPAYKKSGTQLLQPYKVLLIIIRLCHIMDCMMCTKQAIILPTTKCGICIHIVAGHTTIKNADQTLITPKYAIVTIANTVFRKVGLTKNRQWYPMLFMFTRQMAG